MKGILIDKDGTLFDYAYVWGPVVYEAITSGFREMGVKEEKIPSLSLEFEKLFGVDNKGNNYPKGLLFRPDLAPITIIKMVIVALSYGLNPFKVKTKIYSKLSEIGALIAKEIESKEFPGIKELFDRLKEEGYIIGIVTNDGLETTSLFLKKIGIEEHVSFIRGQESNCKKKPSAEAMEQFTKEFHISPSDVAVVGDSKVDLKFAKNAKAGYSVAVLTGSGDVKLLNKMADKVYPTILDIQNDEVLFKK